MFSSASVLALLATACTPDPGSINIHNADPRAEITSHADGDSPEAGSILFSGTVEDPDHDADELELTWMLDGVEACPPEFPDSSGNTSCDIELSSGEHTVSLQVEDPLGGLGSDKVTMDVQPYGEPWAEIDSPVAGNVYYSDQLIEFAGAVGDASDAPSELEAWWEADDQVLDVNANISGSGDVVGSGYLDEGDHLILLKVRNTGDNEGYDSVPISVGPPNSAPSCALTGPEDGAAFEEGESIIFTATATDVDVPSDWLTVTWTSHLDGELGVTTPSSLGDVALPVSSLSVGAHNVTLEVADELGATCTDFVIVTVRDCSTVWYADDDGDGFGDPDSTTTGCDQPSGYVDDDEDCDDRDAAVNPDATEVCNGYDDDCDGDVDDDDRYLDSATASTWYADSDGDGYGDAATTTLACDQPSGYITDASDCDDGDATAYPGAPELCDGHDDDCDGTVDEDDAIDASTWYADSDGDGYGDAGSTTAACSMPSGYAADASDCDDGDAVIHPAASERCDSVDNDCDGTVDEDDAVDAGTWYMDADGDGYGLASSNATACSAPGGYVADSTDCDDTRASVNPGADEYCNSRDDDCDGDTDEDSAVDASTWYEDRDGDGYGDDASTTAACNQPTGFVAYGGDCDDADTAYNPGARESDCADPADYNCDGSTAYSDRDGDGWAACEECDDTDPAISPNAVELCDGADNDCDGTVDEADAADASTWYADNDGDGYGDSVSTSMGCTAPSGHVADATDCDDRDAGAFPGAPEYCDGSDNDCDGTVDESDAVDVSTWYPDSDGDGYGDATAATVRACSAPSGYGSDATDCDDGDATISPGAPEYCDGHDDDCDGTVDEADAVDASTWYLDSDGDGYGGTAYDTTACSQPSGFVADSSDCSDASASIHPGAAESCNGSDDDCDGTVDEDDAIDASTWYADDDRDGYGDAGSSTAACSAPSGYVSDATDCDDSAASTNPGADEYCDGHDDDCDGDTDEADAVDTSIWYVDGDGDGYGLDASTRDACDQPSGYAAYGSDCDDTDAAYNPGASETDCTDPNDYNCDGSTAYTDADGDGFAACEECDDLEPTTHPGADEYCDGVDNDCDGDTDEDDAVDASTWYEDDDGDGYGDAASTASACAAPSGYVADDSDCDDGSASTHPGADEYCDGHDDDCDGDTDEDGALGASTWYLDADSDGYGDASGARDACSQPSGYVANDSDCDDSSSSVHPGASESWYDGIDQDCAGDSDYDADTDGYDSSGYGGTDCDDSDATVNPGAAEICADGVDNDCDGTANECVPSGIIDLSAADVKIIGEDRYDEAGNTIAAGDIDGDGIDDLIIGCQRDDDGGSNAGAAYVVMGPVTSDSDLATADAKLIGEAAGDYAANEVETGDLDGDGIDDILIGAPLEATRGRDAGAGYLFFGPVTGTLDMSAADAKLIAEDAYDMAGGSVHAGDMNNDGLADFIIGAEEENTGGSHAGAAYIVYAPVSGTIDLMNADAKLVGEDSYDAVGQELAVGDADGDGIDDLLIGAPTKYITLSNAGAAYLFHGPISGDLDMVDADGRVTGEFYYGLAGAEIAMGDFDNDGYDDLLVGAPNDTSYGSDRGTAYVVYGPYSGDMSLSYADAQLASESTYDYAGWGVAAGDIDSDGVEDVLVGAPFADSGGANSGSAYLVLGPVSGFMYLTSADAKFIGEAADDKVGEGDLAVGDLNGDGGTDMILSAHEEDSGGSDAGAVYLIFGGGL